MRGLRLYECFQLLVPGIAGLVLCTPGRLPPLRTGVLYGAALFLHLLFTYTYNDYAERERDRDNPRKALLDRGALGRSAGLLFAAWLAVVVWLPVHLIALFVCFQGAAILYSHPRTLWKGRAPLAEGLHAFTGGGYFLGGCWVDGIHWGVLPAAGAFAFAALYTSGSCFGQLRDLEADRRAGLRTLAVVLGPAATRSLGLALQLGALAALIPLARSGWAVAIVLPALGVPAWMLWRGGSLAGTHARSFQARYRTLFAVAVGAVLASSVVPPPAPSRWLESAEFGLASLGRSQRPDGSWPYYRGREPTLADATEYPPRVFPAMHVLATLTGAPEAEGATLERARAFLLREMEEGYVWSGDGRSHTLAHDLGGEPCWLEPDAETTALGLALFESALGLERADLESARLRFDRYRARSGLYRTYFDEFYGERGCVAYDHHDAPSLGSNLHVLGWLEGAGLDAAGLAAALTEAMEQERYWEGAVYYRSLPLLAHLASNAVALGSPSARALLARLVADDEAFGGPDASLTAVELAARLKAHAHRCRLEGRRCPGLSGRARELTARQRPDGSWAAASVYQMDLSREFFERVIYPRVREETLARFGVAATLEQAMAHAELGTFHFGSPAESTAIAVRALLHMNELARGGRG